MIDDIKGQGIPAVLHAAEGNKKNQTTTREVLPEGIKVTNQLKDLLNIVKQDVSFTTDDARVAIVKAAIQSGQYKVDLKGLSEALLDNHLIMAND